MKKTYKFTLPKNKKAAIANFRIEKGDVIIDVMLEDKIQPKDGDFLISKYGNIFIYSDKKPYSNLVYSSYCGVRRIMRDIYLEFSDNWTLKEDCRFATPEEKSDFLKRLENECHKRWNPEAKQLEDIRWRADKDCTYYYVDERGNVLACNDTRGCASDSRYSCGNYFKTRESAIPYADQIKEIFKNSKSE